MGERTCQNAHYGERGCDRPVAGTDIGGVPLCAEHLAWSLYVQRLCNDALDSAGHPELVPDWARGEENN